LGKAITVAACFNNYQHYAIKDSAAISGFDIISHGVADSASTAAVFAYYLNIHCKN